VGDGSSCVPSTLLQALFIERVNAAPGHGVVLSTRVQFPLGKATKPLLSAPGNGSMQIRERT
jgi:hypothetical protein